MLMSGTVSCFSCPPDPWCYSRRTLKTSPCLHTGARSCTPIFSALPAATVHASLEPLAVYRECYLARLLAASGPRKVRRERQVPRRSRTCLQTLDMAAIIVSRRDHFTITIMLWLARVIPSGSRPKTFTSISADVSSLNSTCARLRVAASND